MKKGLLSLLAVALTIVSCQNYDDQFAELTGLVNTLSADVEGLSQVQTDLGTLSSLVASLKTSIDTDFSTIETDIETLEQLLTDVADSQDLGEIVLALEGLQDDVTELLAANAVINQSITINSEATLQYVESLVGTEAEDPSVIVNGSVTVESAFANGDDATTTRINAVTNKIATILGVDNGTGLDLTHSASSTISFNALSFIDKNMKIRGGAFGHDVLTTITGSIDESHAGAFDYPLLSSAATVTLGTDLTSVVLPTSATIGAISTTGSSTGELWLKKATSVSTGKAAVSTLTAPKATAITIGTKAAQTGNVAIATTLNAEINLTSTSLAGNLTVTGGASQTTFFGSSLTYVGGTTTVGDYAEAHFPKVTQFGGTTELGAAVLDLTALSANASGTLEFSRALTVDTQKLVVSSNVTYTAATTAHFASTNQASMTLPVVTTLKVFKQGVKTDLDVSGYTTMTDFTIGGAQGKAPFITEVTNTVTISGDALVNATILDGDYDAVTVTGAALRSLTTGGEIRSFTLNAATGLTAVTMGHDHISGSDAATLVVTGNTVLAALAPSALTYIGNVTITGNGALASLDLSSFDTIPLAGDYAIAISGNKLTGTYVAATEGSTTTAFVEAQVKSDDFNTLMPLIDLAIASRANAAIGNVTYTLTLNLSDTDALTAPTDLDEAIPTDAVGAGTSFESLAVGEFNYVDTTFKALVKPE